MRSILCGLNIAYTFYKFNSTVDSFEVNFTKNDC